MPRQDELRGGSDIIPATVPTEPPAPSSGRNGTFTRATFVTVAVFALNVYYSINHGGELSEIGLVGLLLAGGFNVGSFFDK